MTVCPAVRPESLDYWELLYNQHAVCEALALENAEVARALFHRQVDRLTRLHGPLGIEQAFILLTSLNRGLYNYLQYQLNLSLTACCYDNRVSVQGVRDMSDVFRAGDRIIMAYDAAIRANQGSRTYIEKACAYVQTHLDGDLSLSAVSEAVYLSKCHLCEIFRELVGCTFGDYVRQQRLMREAFGMELNACLCLDTSVEKIQRMGCAEINLALCEEAVPAARILNQKCGTPFLTGAPYGYAGTLAWLEKIGRQLGREAGPVLRAALKKRAAEAMQYRMYGMMLKADKPQVAIFGDAPMVAGLGRFMDELDFPIVTKISRHSLRLYEAADPSVRYLPEEKDRIEILQSLRRTLVLADDVSKRLLTKDNTFLRVSMPLVDGAQIAAHLPFMGPRGADFILEAVEAYLKTLR